MSTTESSAATLTEDLRAAADWIDAHPEARIERAYLTAPTLYAADDARNELETFARAAAEGGLTVEERVAYGAVQLDVMFGDGVRVSASASLRALGGQEVNHVEYTPILTDDAADGAA